MNEPLNQGCSQKFYERGFLNFFYAKIKSKLFLIPSSKALASLTSFWQMGDNCPPNPLMATRLPLMFKLKNALFTETTLYFEVGALLNLSSIWK